MTNSATLRRTRGDGRGLQLKSEDSEGKAEGADEARGKSEKSGVRMK